MTEKGHKDWGPRTEEHTFRTGRTATLRTVIPAHVLIRRVTQSPELSDLLPILMSQMDGENSPFDALDAAQQAATLRMTDLMVTAAFVKPRVVLEDPGPDEVSIEDLDDDEIAEVMELMGRGGGEQEAADTFPAGGADRPDVGGDGENVGRAAESDPGAHARGDAGLVA